MTTFTNLTDARLGHVARLDDQATTIQTVTGRNLITSLGRIYFKVSFPVVFANRPVFSSGAELDPATPFSNLADPIPPECNSIVLGWDSFGAITGAHEGYFTGASLLAVIRGAKGQQTWVNWTFQGPALRNPVNSEDTVVLP